jgi:hypothetical protein
LLEMRRLERCNAEEHADAREMHAAAIVRFCLGTCRVGAEARRVQKWIAFVKIVSPTHSEWLFRSVFSGLHKRILGETRAEHTHLHVVAKMAALTMERCMGEFNAVLTGALPTVDCIKLGVSKGLVRGDERGRERKTKMNECDFDDSDEAVYSEVRSFPSQHGRCTRRRPFSGK